MSPAWKWPAVRSISTSSWLRHRNLSPPSMIHLQIGTGSPLGSPLTAQSCAFQAMCSMPHLSWGSGWLHVQGHSHFRTRHSGARQRQRLWLRTTALGFRHDSGPRTRTGSGRLGLGLGLGPWGSPPHRLRAALLACDAALHEALQGRPTGLPLPRPHPPPLPALQPWLVGPKGRAAHANPGVRRSLGM